jgi:hypothetical protein
MPADRSLGESLAAPIVALYARLRTTLLTSLASRLRRSLTGSDNPEAVARKLVLGVDRELDAVAREAILAADRRGRDEAERELAALGRDAPPTPVDVAARLYDLTSALRATHPQVVRAAGSMYRDTVLAASQADGGTRLTQAQRTWGRLVGDGITGFQDTTGRRWSLESYVEMATRSRLAQTATAAHLDRLGSAGIDLVIVSDVAGECDRCRIVEGKTLSRSGPTGAVRVQHATEDRQITVQVWGTVAEAYAIGFGHPGCRHTLSAMLPGLTKAPRHTEDPEGDAARQRLRYLERQVRAWKLRADTALDPAAGRVAAARARAWQTRIREHVAARPELRRQPQRERVGVTR